MLAIVFIISILALADEPPATNAIDQAKATRDANTARYRRNLVTERQIIQDRLDAAMDECEAARDTSLLALTNLTTVESELSVSPVADETSSHELASANKAYRVTLVNLRTLYGAQIQDAKTHALRAGTILTAAYAEVEAIFGADTVSRTKIWLPKEFLVCFPDQVKQEEARAPDAP
ncbi:MAG: hypothetical protein UY76_C0019G0024 [Candidatus Uhrbacteria bacterium GW2011_GWA2_52_8d]|uniref:Uncharacterized protein n=1 Tax=Candidatus Uhrbacteria bacterium GW2011_GWA2_52_8d TaxID=1618979 RepID=A0A0G2AJF4_9BACT|nr:MAG: hypothetical protein UY76_C0019G0024 [Candidatus Uhrbacteria bacterium GW2011_GWA2_52_8d]